VAASATTATTKASEAAASATTASNQASTSTTQANTSTAQASIATTKANTATTKAATATTKASEASTSASNAAASASTASTQATNSSNSASAGSTSATNSANSATAAASSASTATTKANSATASASTASTQATNSSNSATASANSATASANSATASGNSATAAASSASTATTKRNESSASATAAANSAAAAATALDSFDDRYLGAKSSAPGQDNDGNALVQGALYFDTSANGMKVYDGSAWIAASSSGTASLLTYKYIATNNQTTFTGSDANSVTLTYTASNILVLLNGITLDASDYTATNGSSIVLGAGATTGSELVVVAFKSFTVADHYTESQANALLAAKAPIASPSFTSNVNVAGEHIKLTGSSGETFIAALNTGSGEAVFFMDASNGDLSGSDYAWIKQKNNLDVEIGSAASTNRHLLFSPDGSEKMRVSNSGYVGIGSTSPLALLDLKGSTDTYAAMAKIYLTDLSSNSGSRNWSIGNGGSGYGNLTFGVSNAQNGNPQIAGGGHTNPLVITSSGTVTKPLQPAFHGYLSSSVGSNSGWTKVPLNAEKFDIGNNFNTSNGTFTVPVSGRYIFTAHFHSQTASSYLYLAIYAGSTPLPYLDSRHGYANGTDTMLGGSVIANLTANDAITLHTYSSSANYVMGGGDQRTSLAGYFLG